MSNNNGTKYRDKFKHIKMCMDELEEKAQSLATVLKEYSESLENDYEGGEVSFEQLGTEMTTVNSFETDMIRLVASFGHGRIKANRAHAIAYNAEREKRGPAPIDGHLETGDRMASTAKYKDLNAVNVRRKN